MQAKFRTDRYISEKDTEKDCKLRFDVFKNLYDILYQCQNAYPWDFFSINEFIQNNNLNPEVRFEIDPDGKLQNYLHHPGRFHLPSALVEMDLLRPDAPIVQGERKIVCWVCSPSSEKPALFFLIHIVHMILWLIHCFSLWNLWIECHVKSLIL